MSWESSYPIPPSHFRSSQYTDEIPLGYIWDRSPLSQTSDNCFFLSLYLLSNHPHNAVRTTEKESLPASSLSTHVPCVTCHLPCVPFHSTLSLLQQSMFLAHARSSTREPLIRPSSGPRCGLVRYVTVKTLPSGLSRTCHHASLVVSFTGISDLCGDSTVTPDSFFSI